jgi:23S rRNA pseudouridine2605 synthase
MNRYKGGRGKRVQSAKRSNTEPNKKSHKNISKQGDDIRLNKYISNSGICSRREADENIALGLVTVNGKVITEMGYKVKRTDEVKFDGRRITPEPLTYVLLNKPKGFATTTAEGKGRTVMDLVANATTAKIRPVGRLGRNSVGLLLFTNDDKVMQKFTNSKTGVARLFHVELDRNIKPEDLTVIKEGFSIDGKQISVEEISYVQGQPKNQIGIKIKNTGNSILRTIFEHFKYNLVKIDCVAIGHLTKKDIPRGHWKHLTESEVKTLKML